LFGVALFTLASVLCGLANSVLVLIVLRAFQAIGAALITPASLALILAAFPPQRRAIPISLWGAIAAVASAVGPSLGGAIVDTLGWRWAFFINLPVGLVALTLGFSQLKESRSAEGALTDVPGIIMLILGVGALAFGMVTSSDSGWTSPWTLGPIAMGLGMLGGFIFLSARVAVPALDLSLFRDVNYRFANLATFLFSVTYTAMFFGFFFFLTHVWGYSLSVAGLAITPGPLMVIPSAIIAGQYAARVGHRPLLVLGGIVYALGGVWFYFAVGPAPDFVRAWLPGMLLGGVGVGLVIPSLTGAAVFGLPAHRFGVGSAVNLAVRQLGSVFGVALVVVLLGESLDMSAFKTYLAVLTAGGLATAVLCLPIDTRPARTPIRSEATTIETSIES
jgi:EmrB/QacA subfamily drug resistance transporter